MNGSTDGIIQIFQIQIQERSLVVVVVVGMSPCKGRNFLVGKVGLFLPRARGKRKGECKENERGSGVSVHGKEGPGLMLE